MGINQKRYDLIAVVFLFLMAMILEYREAFSLLEDETLSFRQILRIHYADEYLTSPSEEVIVVYTDEAFYEEYDKYPLTRVDLATLISRLSDMGVAVIGVDMLLDFNSAYGEDPVLEEALENAGNVLMVSQAQISDEDEFLGLNTAIDRFEAVTNHGYSNISSSSTISESITRLRIYEQIAQEIDEWPFAVETVSMYLGEEPELSDNTLRIGPDIEVALDQFNQMYIDYPLLPGSGSNTLRHHEVSGISAADVLFAEDEYELEELSYIFEGTIVLIGEVAEVAHDEFETPVGNVYGVSVIANTIDTILKSGPLKPASLMLELIVGFLLLAVFLATRKIQNPLPRNAVSAGVLIAYVVLSTLLYVSHGLVLSMIYMIIAMILSIIVINARFYASEMGQKTMIRDMFGQYLSPKVVEDLVDDPTKLSLGGEEREMTAFFSDVAGFSTISENLTPSELVHVLNDYLTEMCNIIIGLEGTVDKFEGDAIIAFWGAPTVQPEHARLACFASIDMNDRLVELRDKWVAEGIPQLKVRMGLNSGPMVVGNMGSLQRMNYTIMGDAVNLAARLEGANKAFGSRMMISESTYRACESEIDARELDTIRVVGKSEPVTVYELLNRKNQTAGNIADLAEQYARGLAAYRDMDFSGAKDIFERCLEIVPGDGPAETFVQRCQAFIENPPGNEWDRVFTLTEKG
ncbi:MAG: adenylate/guanylate cyclase domain-containing protein [Pseudomonadales bacterium]|nr:adenylate/guanylate cyclase domain-containing protein [Pseudomonadales bacterium]